MFWIFSLSEAILTNIQNICCLKFNAILLHISHQLSPLERRVRDIQIVIVTNFVVLSSVGIKRVDCITLSAGSYHIYPTYLDRQATAV